MSVFVSTYKECTLHRVKTNKLIFSYLYFTNSLSRTYLQPPLRLFWIERLFYRYKIIWFYRWQLIHYYTVTTHYCWWGTDRHHSRLFTHFRRSLLLLTHKVLRSWLQNRINLKFEPTIMSRTKALRESKILVGERPYATDIISVQCLL